MQGFATDPPLFRNVVPAAAISSESICSVVVDAEEDFDWAAPVQGTRTSTSHMKNVRLLCELLGAFGIVPTYLLTYPVLEDDEVIHIVRRQFDAGQCAIGVQLHPWVTPPFDGSPSRHRSFSGNLGGNLEERKLVALKARFRQAFGFDPTVYRAGRYGLSENSSAILEKHGFEIDTSVAPRTDFSKEGGVDYSSFGSHPFWFGRHRRLLEIPLCRDVVGWAGAAASSLYRSVSGELTSRFHVLSVLTRSRCAERITLSPEGNDTGAMRRLVRGLRSQRQPVFTLSFHSSSLQVGRNPYVQSQADLHRFYDRMSATLDYLATDLSFRFASIQDIPALLTPPPPLSAVP